MSEEIIFYNIFKMKKASVEKLKMPERPGVYFFLNGKSESFRGLDPENPRGPTPEITPEILYIGKATSLKDRVKSYFSKDLIETRGPLLVDMVWKATDIKWQETDSVLEALILEANLIKKYQPYYNTKEKDDKSFNYVCITKEELPKVLIVRGKELQKKQENSSRFTLPLRGGSYAMNNFPVSFAKVFGPFTSGSQLKEALKIIRKIFPFLDDKSKSYHEFYKQIHLAPNLDEKNKYLDNIKNIKLLFEGKKKKIVFDLKKEMLALAKEKKFEEASLVKRKIFALGHINDVALIKEDIVAGGERLDLGDSRGPTSKNPFRIEAYDIAHMSGQNMVGVMVVLEDGEVNKNKYRKFKIKTQKDANDTGALKEVLERRFNHPEWRLPDLIVLDGSTSQINATEKILQDLPAQTGKNIDINIVAVTKDERHKAKEIKGDEKIIKKYQREILLANSEAHRFAINYHKNRRAKNFLKKYEK